MLNLIKPVIQKESDMSNTELLQAILSKIEGLEKALIQQNESRVKAKEFAARLGVSIPTLYTRIAEGLIEKPLKDGKLSYWLNSYVNLIVVGRTGNLKY